MLQLVLIIMRLIKTAKKLDSGLSRQGKKIEKVKMLFMLNDGIHTKTICFFDLVLILVPTNQLLYLKLQ